MATIGLLQLELAANVARLETDLNKAGRHVKYTERLMSDAVSNINSMFRTLGITIGAGAFAHFIKGTIDSADALVDLHEKTGTSIKDLAGLKFAAEQNSTSLEAVAMAGKMLAVTLSDKPELFARMGITAKDSTGAMIQLADVFAGMPDGVNKTALAVKLMGKNGEEMIPFMNQGSAALRDYIDKGREYSNITEDSARSAKQFNDQLAELKTQAEGNAMSFANALLPTLTNISGQFVNSTGNATAFAAAGQGVGEVLKVLVVLGANTAYTFEQIGIGIGGMAAQLVALAHGDFAAVSDIQKMMIADGEAARAEIDKFSDSVINGSNKITAAAAAAKSGQGTKLLDALGGGEGGKPPKMPKMPKPAEDADAMVRAYEQNQASLISEGAGMDVAAREQEAYDRKLEAARFYHEQLNTDASAYAQMRELVESDHQSRLVELGRQGALSREQFEKLSGKNQLLITTGTMAAIIGASAQHSRAMFDTMKVMKLAEAAISLPSTVMKAYESGMMAGGPFGPAVGAAYAAMAFASQMIQINAIRSASFGGGSGGSAPSAGGASSIALPGQEANPGIVAASAPAAPKTGMIVNVNLGDDPGMPGAKWVRDFAELLNEQIRDGVVIEQIRVS